VPFLEESLGSMLEAAFSHPQQPDMALSVAQDPFVRESSAGTAALRRAVSHSACESSIPSTSTQAFGMAFWWHRWEGWDVQYYYVNDLKMPPSL